MTSLHIVWRQVHLVIILPNVQLYIFNAIVPRLANIVDCVTSGNEA